ncbi:MAG TPA: hypothetical protein DE060_15945 [Lentisphaeria bacterium]|nr:hypothetical protein [Lentisphaeria bacterium]HCG50680.1 hypothetical protein [Lentisphaeria bacterium]
MKGTFRRLKIGVSGVRGVVGESLSPVLVADFAAAFGEFAGGGRVLVGRDTRSSGEMYENAVAAGLLSVGIQPVLTGILPTPSLQVAVRETSASGAIAITASHNGNEWNALKFIGADGLFLNQIANDELLDIYNQPDSNYVPENRIRTEKLMYDAFRIHQEKILRSVDTDAIRKKHFRVAVDCCNGVGALYSRKFLEAFGCEVISIFDTCGNGFERPPEPVPANLGALSECVKKHHCAVGFAQDPDGDRISLVSGSGAIPGVQNSAALIAGHLIRNNRSGTVVLNIQTTTAIEQIAGECGVEVLYCPVGEVNVTDAMNASGAFLGIEGSSGGIIYPKISMCRDSYAAMAVVLEMLAQRGMTIDSMLETLPCLSSVSVKVLCPSAQAGVNALREIRSRYLDRNPIVVDGVRIDMGGGAWVLLRRSNTEPVIRILAESSEESTAERLARDFEKELQGLLKK